MASDVRRNKPALLLAERLESLAGKLSGLFSLGVGIRMAVAEPIEFFRIATVSVACWQGVLVCRADSRLPICSSTSRKRREKSRRPTGG